jgi:hypothetical protein
LPLTEKKAAIFSVRLSPEERDQIEAAAQALGLKAAAWARLVLLDAAKCRTLQPLDYRS